MRCVLVSNGIVTAVSDCEGMPTAPGWKKAWHGETYVIGEPSYLFDGQMRRKPLSGEYGQACKEKRDALENARKACIAADIATYNRKKLEETIAQIKKEIEVKSVLYDQHVVEEKAALELAETAEQIVCAKEAEEHSAAQALIDEAAEAEQKVKKEQEEKGAEEKAVLERAISEEAIKLKIDQEKPASGKKNKDRDR